MVVLELTKEAHSVLVTTVWYVTTKWKNHPAQQNRMTKLHPCRRKTITDSFGAIAKTGKINKSDDTAEYEQNSTIYSRAIRGWMEIHRPSENTRRESDTHPRDTSKTTKDTELRGEIREQKPLARDWVGDAEHLSHSQR